MKPPVCRHVLALPLVVTSFMLSIHAAEEDSSNLLLRYEFEETEGTKVADLSGRGLDGTYVNKAAWDKGMNGRAFQMACGEATVDMVSVQSVSHPGYYLTLEGDNLVLAKNDNTTKFKRGATFRVVPGLADKAWVSFQSLADPQRFIQQYDGVLKVSMPSPSGSMSDESGATFKIE